MDPDNLHKLMKYDIVVVEDEVLDVSAVSTVPQTSSMAASSVGWRIGIERMCFHTTTSRQYDYA